MRLYKLPDTVLSVKAQAVQFLSGLTSNTPDAPLNAFLNQHGRIIATFRQRKVSDDEVMMGVPAIAVENLLNHLERYAKLSHARVERSGQSVFIDLDSVQTVWDTASRAGSISDEEFTLFRLNHRIPLMGVDYQADEFILNVHEHDYVSYTKGCFLGQEPVAKVHNRSVPSRKLTVQFEDECSVQEAAKMTSRAREPGSTRTKGFVFVANKTP